jgi:glycosyltransferase involved in cell wall biosynthesis
MSRSESFVSSSMKISIVVPAYNEEKVLPASLPAIVRSAEALAPHSWELIVCDNNSTDRTAEIARSFGAKVVFEPVNQIARARNRGAAEASGEWIIFVDADSYPSPALFESALRRMQDPRCAGGGCLVKLDENPGMYGVLVAIWNGMSVLMRWAAGSFIYCRTELFREIGGFSTKLYASEEVELCGRLKRAARRRGMRLMIIREERLLTSARKLHLYSRREHFWFFLKAFVFPRRVLANRDECVLWYNGRR